MIAVGCFEGKANDNRISDSGGFAIAVSVDGYQWGLRTDARAILFTTAPRMFLSRQRENGRLPDSLGSSQFIHCAAVSRTIDVDTGRAIGSLPAGVS